MVYDPVHHQTVLFGGADTTGTALAETWVYNGSSWTNVTPVATAPNPSARLWAGMAFDAATGTAILFGGCAQIACTRYLGDTWSWNGSTWTNMLPLGTPSPRRAPAMAYSPTQTNGGVLLFGGYNGAALGDMYIWDGTSWNTPEADAPTAREWASMSYDAASQEVVMFGGDDGTTPVNETWLWDGNFWTLENPAASPAARSNQGQVWDPVRQLTVMFGGDGRNDTWLWNTSSGTWTQETTATSPPGRFDVNMAYDTQHAQAVIFGGQNSGGDLGDTWTLGYTYTQSWMQVDAANDPSAPSPRTSALAVTYGNDVLLFGGYDGTNVLNDTWLYTGREWGIATSGGLKPARIAASMASDLTNGNVVLFGGAQGIDGSGLLNDTWLFTDGIWTAAAPSTKPSARDNQSMVYDAANSNVMMFGGFNTSGTETWIWNGSNWNQLSPATTPTGRTSAALVFDYARNQVLMFGGFEILTGTPLNDTWVWNGTNWTQLSPANSPPARGSASMVFDAVHGTVLLFGGQQLNDMNDTWQWDGVNWTQLSPASSPTFLDSAATAYLPSSGLFLFGGQSNGTILGQAWTFGSPYANTILPTGFNSQAYSTTIAPAGGVGPYTFSDDGIPTTLSAVGLSLNTTTGAITGTDNLIAAENVSFGITITDSQGQIADLSFELRTDSAIAFTPSPPPLATVGTNYNAPLSATGGTPPFTYSATGLPAGLAIQGSSIQGSCQNTVSSPNVTITATDSVNGMATAGSFTISCNPAPLVTNTTPLAQGSVGQSYGVQLTTNALYGAPGASPYTWSAPANSLPAGLSLVATTGQITGVPAAAGTSTFTVTFTDAWGATTSSQFRITVINPLTIATTQLATGNMGFGYPAGQAIAATGGVPAYTFGATSLPPGLQINPSTGAITGTPTKVGAYNPNFTVIDSTTAQVSQIIPIYVVQPGTNSEDWIQLFPATSPGMRSGAGTFYDSVHGQTVLFGGNGGNALGDTYSWNGTNWTALSPAASPSARFGAAAAFDPTHQQGVLFGGLDSGFNPLNDTWLWNGTTWTQATPANSPGARSYAMMAWDGQHIVLFGGSVGESDYSDTWTWDGANWTQASPAASPGARDSAGMAYDSTHGNVVLFGGNNPGLEGDFDDTWTWNGANWTQASPANSPQGRDSLVMAFDSLRGETVLFGGYSQNGESDMPDTWEWNGTNWAQLTPLHNPAARDTYSMVFDTARSEIMLFGGAVPSSSNFYANDTWIFEGPYVTGGNLPAGTEGTPYSDTPPEVSGIAPLTYTDSGAPAWLAINPATGALTGTPNATGNSQISDIVIDSFGVSSTANLALTINPPSVRLVLSPTTLPNATAGANYLEQLSATGGVPNYTFSASGLPTGLQLNASNQITGQCTASSSNVILKVTDSASEVAIAGPLTVTCNAAPAITTSKLPDGVVNTAYSTNLALTGGTPPIAWSISKGSLPAGINLTGNQIAGTATFPVSAQFTVKATDFWGAASTVQLTLDIASVLIVNTTSLPNGTVGVNYGIAIRASGGTPPYTWSLVAGAGSLPAGLNLDAQGGNVFGTPAAAGTSTFSVQVTDGQQTSQPKQLSLTIAPAPAPLTIQSAAQLPPGLVGTAYSQMLSAAGGSGQYTWALTGGTLPGGLTLATSGAITGTPTTAQTANFRASVGDTSGNSLSAGFTIVVASSNTVALLTPNPLPNGAVGVVYSYGVQVLGGTPPYFYAITAGQVPPGLNFDATNGTFSGTPTQAGNFGLVLNVTDSGGASGAQAASLASKPSPRAATSANYAIQIAAPGGFQITTAENLPIASLAQAYSTMLDASGGAAPYTWTLVNGILPAGLTLNPGGTITGSPSQAGLASLVIKATDTTGASVTGAFLLQVANPNIPAISPLPLLPSGTVGQAYQGSLTAVGGHPPYAWSVASGSLPPGLTSNAQTGALSGTPTQAGSFPFTAEVTDSGQVIATQAFTIRVDAMTLQITPPTIPAAMANAPYSLSLSVAGGTPPYNWSLSAGGLLSGFTIDPSTGAITGTPTAPGTYPFTITVIDSNFGMATQTFQLIVQAATLSISTASVPAGTVGAAYNFGLQASNSNPPLTWSATGNLPPGIQLAASSGILAGTPTTAGSYTFTTHVQDSTSATAQATFTLVVNPQPLTIVTTSLPNGAIATSYSQTVQSSGGTNPITWSISAGTLPAGLSLGATTGTISGTPSASGSFSFTVEATDSNKFTAQQPYTVTIAGPPAVPAITLSGLPATSTPGDQPTVTITLASPYALPITVTATLSISPNPGNSTDLMFSNGSRTTQITIPANTTTATLQFQTGTLPGTIGLSLSLSAGGVNVTPATAPSATTTIAASAPVISSVTVTATSGGIQVVVVGASTTLDMKTATFQFTPAAGATLQTTSVTIDVSSLFAGWYSSAASLATGSQFSLTVPFTVGGNVSTIASVSVTLTNSAGASAAVSANVP
jgi:hypothetical protein